MFIDILKVGAVSCFSPLQSVLTISIFTHMLAGFGTADPRRLRHRRAARIHADLGRVRGRHRLGADGRHGDRRRRIARARRIAWTAGSVSFVSVGAIGTLHRDLPDLWVNIFTDDAERARRQPAISVDGRRRCTPSSASRCRCIFVAGRGQGAWAGAGADRAAVVHRRSAAGGCRRMTRPLQNFFALAAASMVVLGVLSCLERDADAMGPEAARAQVRPALSG